MKIFRVSIQKFLLYVKKKKKKKKRLGEKLESKKKLGGLAKIEMT